MSQTGNGRPSFRRDSCVQVDKDLLAFFDSLFKGKPIDLTLFGRPNTPRPQSVDPVTESWVHKQQKDGEQSHTSDDSWNEP
jgi:hypothetical protein